MDKETYGKIEQYMLSAMADSAHDALHIYRVLYQALVISRAYKEVNRDVLIASCLLHDIGRDSQFRDPQLCHAVEGGEMAYAFMKGLGWPEDVCLHVQDCITTHRFRTDKQPQTIEAKILFDADKLDATGALGIARTLLYKGHVGQPLYIVDQNNRVQDGSDPAAPKSFFKECHFKLFTLYDRFYTKEAYAIAQRRKELTERFYHELLDEVSCDGLDELLHIDKGGLI